MSRFRRRILAKVLQVIPSDWTFEWDASKGDLKNNGFTVSGNNGYGGGYTLTSEGQLFTVNNSQNVTVETPTNSNEKITLLATFNASLLSNLGIQIAVSDGNTSTTFQIINDANGYHLDIQTGQWTYTSVGLPEAMVLNQDFEVQIEREPSGAVKVYFNNIVCYDGPSYNTGYKNTLIRVRYNSTVLLKSLKLKY